MDMYLDMDAQRCAVANEKQRSHEKWVQKHSSALRLDLTSSRIRLRLLVDEACAQERMHLMHQYHHVKQLIGNTSKKLGDINRNASPARRAKEASTDDIFGCASSAVSSKQHGNCACVRAPAFRVLTPKYRAMNLLRMHYDASKLEVAVDALRDTYNDDNAMMGDLIERFGDEPEPEPAMWLRSIDERMRFVDDKWSGIGKCVSSDMDGRDNYQTVIRNLSIMRIFLEGSQSSMYGCDTSERSRRDALHQRVLDRLYISNQLFV